MICLLNDRRVLFARGCFPHGRNPLGETANLCVVGWNAYDLVAAESV